MISKEVHKEAIERFKNDDTHLPKDAVMEGLAKRIQTNPQTALQLFSGMKESEIGKFLENMTEYFKKENLDPKNLEKLKTLLNK